MKFSELIGPVHFVVINPSVEMPVFWKDANGRVRTLRSGQVIEDNADVSDDIEVQPVFIPSTMQIHKKLKNQSALS